ncbi:MAG: ABC transporter ATP-binding protein [Proteobacteria bacterium]|nr:ABC transporter ATP-binding protein [Pseudomonadota bacterium]
MLEVQGLAAGYGAAAVIAGIDLALSDDDALTLIGRNGAGKSTAIKAIMGVNRPTAGSIAFQGRRIDGKGARAAALAGIAYVPEDRRIFQDLSVAENLEAGRKPGPAATTWTAARVFELFPEIARRRHAPAGTLSGGEKQMLAIGRALMGNPVLLLLDEPSEGLAPVVVDRLADVLLELRRDGIAILLSEQSRRLATRVSERVMVLETGRIVFSGTFADLDADPGIALRYLGV